MIISDNVTTIGEYTFDTMTDRSSRATPTITIGKNVKTIGKGAFYVIGDLSLPLGNDSTRGKVYCKPITPPEYDYHDNFICYDLYVPREALELYKTHDKWDIFDNEITNSSIYGYDF